MLSEKSTQTAKQRGRKEGIFNKWCRRFRSSKDWVRGRGGTYSLKVVNSQPNFALCIKNTSQITPGNGEIWLGFNGFRVTCFSFFQLTHCFEKVTQITSDTVQVLNGYCIDFNVTLISLNGLNKKCEVPTTKHQMRAPVTRVPIATNLGPF